MPELPIRHEQHKRQYSLAEQIRFLIHNRQQKERKISIHAKKPREKERKKATGKAGNVSSHLSYQSAPRRPIEQVLVGSWNAVQKYPEWLGKQTLVLYDRLRFPKLTSEEQKMRDRTHEFLKKYQKTIGWTETGIQAVILGVGVAKGLRYLRERRRGIGTVSQIAPRELKKQVKQAESALPPYLRMVLDKFGATMDEKLRDKEMPLPMRETLKQNALHRIGTILAGGVPDDIADQILAMKTAGGDLDEAGGKIIIDWLHKVRPDEDGREFVGDMMAFHLVGFARIADLDIQKLRHMDAVAVRGALDAVFRIASKGMEFPGVKDAVGLVVQAFKDTQDTGIQSLRPDLERALPDVVRVVYNHFYQNDVAAQINALPTRDKQLEALNKVVAEFFDGELKRTTLSEEDGTKATIISMGFRIVLRALGFPGVEKLGMLLKQS